MNEHLRDRILRTLEALSDERGYQVLDYVEFLEERYGEKPTGATNAFTRFTEVLEDRLRAGKVSATAIADTVTLMNRAANVLNGALQATKTAANEFVSSASGSTPKSGSAQPTSPALAAEASSLAGVTPHPGSGEEKL